MIVKSRCLKLKCYYTSGFTGSSTNLPISNIFLPICNDFRDIIVLKNYIFRFWTVNDIASSKYEVNEANGVNPRNHRKNSTYRPSFRPYFTFLGL